MTTIHLPQFPPSVLAHFLGYVGAREYQTVRELFYDKCISLGGSRHHVVYMHPRVQKPEDAPIVIMGEVHDDRRGKEANAAVMDALVKAGSLFLAENHLPVAMGPYQRKKVVELYKISKGTAAKLSFSGWDCLQNAVFKLNQKADALKKQMQAEKKSEGWLLEQLERAGRECDAEMEIERQPEYGKFLLNMFQARNRSLASTVVAQSKQHSGKTFVIAGMGHIKDFSFLAGPDGVRYLQNRWDLNEMHTFFETTPCLVIYPEASGLALMGDVAEGKRPEGDKEGAASPVKLAHTTPMASAVRLCFQCHKKETPDKKLSVCGGCKGVTYCSRDCQAAHWARHKQECKPKGKK